MLGLILAVALSVGADSPKAEELFRAAQIAQQGEGPAPAVTSFRGRMQSTLIDYDEAGKARKTEIDLLQMWARRDDRLAYRREVRHDGAKGAQIFVVSFDGKCWEIRDGRPRRLRGRDDQEDVRKLRRERDRCERLFELFFLSKIAVKPGTLRLVKSGEVVKFDFGLMDRYAFKTHQLALEDTSGRRFRLWVDEKTHHLVKASVASGRTGDDAEVFLLAEHYTVPVTGTDRRVAVPFRIVYSEGGRVRAEISALRKNFGLNVLKDDEIEALFLVRK